MTTATTENAQYTQNLIIYWTKQYNETAYRIEKLTKEGKVESVKVLTNELQEMADHISNLRKELQEMLN